MDYEIDYTLFKVGDEIVTEWWNGEEERYVITFLTEEEALGVESLDGRWSQVLWDTNVIREHWRKDKKIQENRPILTSKELEERELMREKMRKWLSTPPEPQWKEWEEK